MKSSYSYQVNKLLLVLLLITANTTLTISAPAPAGFFKQLGKFIVGQGAKYIWKKGIIQNLPESQRENEHIDGLYKIKRYLFDFGYLQNSGPYDNSLDKETISAIKTYQKTFNLQDDGFLNKQTLEQISLPRCGVPDINLEYSLSGTNSGSWPHGNKWHGKDKKLTYGFAPESNIPPNMIEVLKNALTQWSTTTMVPNIMMAPSYEEADIKIGFYISNDEGVDDVVVGDSFITLQNSHTSGLIRLDASKYWLLPTHDRNPSWENGEFDLVTVAMHQIGHLLGLDHSFETNSIMYPIINQIKVSKSDSDITNMNQLYNNANYGNFGSSASSLVTLFLGFAFVAMFN